MSCEKSDYCPSNFEIPMKPALSELLRNAQDVKLVIDGVTVMLTVGPQPLPKSPDNNDPTGVNSFRFDSGLWRIRFIGRAVERKDSVGLAYIHELLRHPQEFMSAEELWVNATGENVGYKSNKQFVQEGYARTGLSLQSQHSEPIVPDETRERLLQTLKEMEEDLSRLKDDGDEDLAFEKQQEIEAVQEYLKKSSFRGHKKRFADDSERARKRVSIAIARAIQDLQAEHPALARHLDNSIRTGKECRYAPEHAVQWRL